MTPPGADRSRMVTTAALAFSVAVLTAQAIPPPPVQDRAVIAPQSGTARLSGVVVVNEPRGQPINRVILLLNGGGLVVSRQTTTDDEGRFAFAGLPPGRYTLTGWRSGFVRDSYGTKRPGAGNGVAIDVGNGETIDITMKLTRQAVITGAIVTAGAPFSSSYVQAMEYKRVGRERRLVQAVTSGVSPNGGLTGFVDDRGVYRIYGLPPGEYVVMTSPYTLNSDLRMMTPSLVEWANLQFQRNGGAPPALPRAVGYAPVFYPGTTDASAAVSIRVSAGEERNGIDLPLQLVPVAKIEGIAIGPGGQPVPGVQLTLQPLGSVVARTSGSARSLADGRFTISGVTPGRHRIVARVAPGAPGRGVPLTPTATVEPLFAQMDIDVAGQDIRDLTIVLQPGGTLSGRVVFDGQSPPPPAGSLRVYAMTEADDFFFAAPSAPVTADGTFTMTGIGPGQYRLGAGTSGGPWALRSSMYDGRDLIDEPLEMRPGQSLAGVTTTFTDRRASLSGRLTDGADKGTSDYFVVAFPTDRKFWTWNSRRVVSARPANTGAYSFANLQPGEYFLCVVTDVDPSEIYDASFLEPLTRSAQKITVADGEQKVQNLKVAGSHD